MALITLRARAAVVLVVSWVAVLPHCASLDAIPPTCGDGGAACDAEAGPVCDPKADPKDDPLCVADAFGVFVSPTGDDANPGTKAKPVQTIAKGISLTEKVKRIYVCEGTYEEDVSIAPPADGIGLFGGFSCSDWSYTGNKSHLGKTRLALAITATTQPITIEDFYVRARDGVLGNPSSVAALVANATAPVTFRRVSLDAGSAIAGPDGVTGSNYDTKLVPTDAKIEGSKTSSGIAGAAQTCANLCVDGKASGGGAGGAGGTSPSGGTSGSATPVIAGLQSPNDGAGGDADMGSGCSIGHHGGDAIAGTDGAMPTALGTLLVSGWNPADSADGKNGGTGEGGGGGGGATFIDDTHGGGGGGGCGGCGGAGGAAGVGGGSSIALAILSSNVTLVSSELHAGVAGDGGRGALGQTGQIGGAGGIGDPSGCSGGIGGKGATGGGGAGGVGGSSVAVLYKGTAPNIDASTQASITFGAQGTKGLGSSPGVNDGIDGVSMATLKL